MVGLYRGQLGAPNRRKAVRAKKPLTTENPSPPEGYDEVEFENRRDSEGVEELELSPGETLEGRVVGLKDGESKHGDWFRLRVDSDGDDIVDYFAKGDVKRACREGKVRVGSTVWIAMMTETESFENDDGEEQEYHPTEIQIREVED